MKLIVYLLVIVLLPCLSTVSFAASQQERPIVIDNRDDMKMLLPENKEFFERFCRNHPVSGICSGGRGSGPGILKGSDKGGIVVIDEDADTSEEAAGSVNVLGSLFPDNSDCLRPLANLTRGATITRQQISDDCSMYYSHLDVPANTYVLVGDNTCVSQYIDISEPVALPVGTKVRSNCVYAIYVDNQGKATFQGKTDQTTIVNKPNQYIEDAVHEETDTSAQPSE